MMISKHTFVLVCNVVTFILVDLITGITIAAAFCALISGILAARDWETSSKQREIDGNNE